MIASLLCFLSASLKILLFFLQVQKCASNNLDEFIEKKEKIYTGEKMSLVT